MGLQEFADQPLLFQPPRYHKLAICPTNPFYSLPPFISYFRVGAKVKFLLNQ